jgi:hypothetical protein
MVDGARPALSVYEVEEDVVIAMKPVVFEIERSRDTFPASFHLRVMV